MADIAAWRKLLAECEAKLGATPFPAMQLSRADALRLVAALAGALDALEAETEITLRLGEERDGAFREIARETDLRLKAEAAALAHLQEADSLRSRLSAAERERDVLRKNIDLLIEGPHNDLEKIADENASLHARLAAAESVIAAARVLLDAHAGDPTIRQYEGYVDALRAALAALPPSELPQTGDGVAMIDRCAGCAREVPHHEPWCVVLREAGHAAVRAVPTQPATPDERVLDDAFGNWWTRCERPDCALEIVRPGKVQCDDGKPCLMRGGRTVDANRGDATRLFRPAPAGLAAGAARRGRREPMNTNDKRRHVTTATQTRSHHCHWPGCERQVPPAMWGCRKHWFRLPRRLRNAIWRTYQPGQESGDAEVSSAYLDAADEVQRWIESNAEPSR